MVGPIDLAGHGWVCGRCYYDVRLTLAGMVQTFVGYRDGVSVTADQAVWVHA